jgi:hypothetical protein
MPESILSSRHRPVLFEQRRIYAGLQEIEETFQHIDG